MGAHLVVCYAFVGLPLVAGHGRLDILRTTNEKRRELKVEMTRYISWSSSARI